MANTVFKKNKTYKFGVLTKATENTPKFPEFVNSPKSISLHGDYLIEDLGVKNFIEYLKKNPNNYPTNKILTCFEIDEKSGELKKLDEGNPYPESDKDKNGEGIADNPIAQQVYSNPTGRIDKDVINMFKEQIDRQNSYISNLQNELQNLQDKLIQLETEKAELKGDITKLTIERDTYKNVIEEVGKNDEGLSDNPVFEKLTKGLAGVIEQPEVQQFIGSIFAKIGNKFIPQNSQVQQPVQQPNNVNTDGVSTKPGEFDENPL